MENKQRACIYCRVANDCQIEPKPIDMQKERLIEFAKSNGYEVVDIFTDVNVSGLHFQRDGIMKLREAAIKGLMDTVLIKDLSRLGRHMYETSVFIDSLKKLNVEVVSATEGTIPHEMTKTMTDAVRAYMNKNKKRKGAVENAK